MTNKLENCKGCVYYGSPVKDNPCAGCMREGFIHWTSHAPKHIEMVNHPPHYNTGKIEVIDAIEDWKLGFNLGNTVKYVARAGHKNNTVEDLQKAAWYLNREIERLKNAENL